MTKTISPLRDHELMAMLGRDPELLAIADALVETARAHPPRPRRRFIVISAPVVALAAAVSVVVLLWPFASSPSVLDKALAAVGSGSVTHLVVEEDLGSTLLDLHTGKQSPASGRLSLWYAPKHGVLFQLSFMGVSERSVFVSMRANTVLGRAASEPFILTYRSALRAHQFHVSGSGTYGGTPVYWIESAPVLFNRAPDRYAVEQIAISKATYKPVFFRRLINGSVTPGSSERILLIESTQTGPSALYGSHTRFSTFGSNIGIYNNVLQYEPLNLAQAQAMHPQPLIPREIDGTSLRFIGRAPYTTSPDAIQNIPGVLLYYGATFNSGLPNDIQPGYTGRWVQVTEFPHANAVTRAFRGHFPAEGRAIIDGLASDIASAYGQPSLAPQFGAPGSAITAHSAALKAKGRYFIIDATTKADAITAARTLANSASH